MDLVKLERLFQEINSYYKQLGGYRTITPDRLRGIENHEYRMIGEEGQPNTIGYYHVSLSLDSLIVSSKTNKSISLDPASTIFPYYYISESQGYNNARIIAHIGSWGGNQTSLFAWVYRKGL